MAVAVAVAEVPCLVYRNKTCENPKQCVHAVVGDKTRQDKATQGHFERRKAEKSGEKRVFYK